MKKFAFLFMGAVALALSACGDADDAAGDTTIVETESAGPAPAVTETTTVVRDDADGDSVTVSERGLKVDVDDGDTRVEADLDKNPSVTVRN